MSEIPVIYINSEEDEEKYLKEYKFSIHQKILKSVENSFKDNIDSIELFQIVNRLRGFTFIVMVEKSSWVDSLEKCLMFFQETEEYELCEKTLNLINVIKKDEK